MNGLGSDDYCWFPVGTRNATPESGQLIAFKHQAWWVVGVRTQAADVEHPLRVWLRPARLADHPDPVTAASGDQYIDAPTRWVCAVYPDPEHYPVCAGCGEPVPCRDETGRETAEAAMAAMSLYEREGVCPACEDRVTSRQRSVTFPDNLMIPGGPPVTFHTRRGCGDTAIAYERRWVAADPRRRRTALWCGGHLTNHNDGTYDCTQQDCAGPTAEHRSAAVCDCPSCHAGPWMWGRGCVPSPRARRNGT